MDGRRKFPEGSDSASGCTVAKLSSRCTSGPGSVTYPVANQVQGGHGVERHGVGVEFGRGRVRWRGLEEARRMSPGSPRDSHWLSRIDQRHGDEERGHHRVAVLQYVWCVLSQL